MVHGENCLGWPKWGREDLFPANSELADILGDMDLDFENFHLYIVLDSKFLDFQVPRSPNSKICRFPDFQVPRFPDGAGAAAAGRILRSQPDPSTNAPRDQIRRKEP